MADTPANGSGPLVDDKGHLNWGNVIKLLCVVVPAVVASLGAYHSASGDTAVKAQEVKDKAESGYQIMRHALEERDAIYEKRISELERRVRDCQPHPAARRGSRPRALPAPSPAAAAPKPLPGDLDKAERQVYAGKREPARVTDASTSP